MDQIQKYLLILFRGWWVIVLTSLIALASSLFVSYETVPEYKTKSRFLVLPTLQLEDDRDVINSINTLKNRTVAATYAEILKSSLIFNSTMDALSVEKDDVGEYTITAVVLPEASIIEMTMVGTKPDLLVRVHNGIGQETIRFVRDTYDIYDLVLLDQAKYPKQPFSPQPVQSATIAVGLGIGIGVVLLIAWSEIWPLIATQFWGVNKVELTAEDE